MAMSCDLLPTDAPGPHHQGDVRDVLHQDWDLIVAHPPCTYLSVSGLHWNKRNPERAAYTEAALNFVAEIWLAKATRMCVENPVGCINTRLSFMPKPCIIQPYEFGEDASKRTCLWLRGLPPLKGTTRIPPRIINGKPRWANQTDSGQNRLGPSPDRWKIRSETYTGIAQAMADQWGPLL